VTRTLQNLSKQLYSFVDWFIPAKLKANSDLIQGVRMFLFSHLFGPFLGHTITLYILFVRGEADFSWWVFFGAITLFWPFSFVLRRTGWYVPLALISVQNLIFCITWGCYHYGGISSPILPWMITVPLLAFFYLPTRATRLMVSMLIGANLLGFFIIYNTLGFPPAVDLDKLVGLGLVSTFCAGVYVSMMALYYSNIVSSQSELEQEIKRHRDTERLLRSATEQVKRATRAKSEFLAKMSHELRNPLNAIIGYSEMLLEETSPNDQKSQDLKSIKGAGYKLLELVNDLLDLSKLEAGRMEVSARPFDLRTFVDEISAEWLDPIKAGGNELRIECTGELGEAFGDAVKLRQVLGNLLGNAAKFTKQGTVTVTVSNQDGTVAIAIRDTGIGMSPDQVVNLFETFGTSDHETSSNYGEDPGLGLPLSQRLCRLLCGDLTVESELGRGSCFTIRIPTRLSGMTDIASPAIAGGGSARAEGTAPRPILVIDDDPSVCDLVARILGKEGFTPVLTHNASEGLALARQILPDVIILDVRMAEPDSGWQALRAIRQDPQLRHCRVIMLTVDDDFEQGRLLGADAHLIKPIDRDELLRTIDSVWPAPVRAQTRDGDEDSISDTLSPDLLPA
jgi:signal transduction histidine kinase/CheY-like chemotaxis protein